MANSCLLLARLCHTTFLVQFKRLNSAKFCSSKKMQMNSVSVDNQLRYDGRVAVVTGAGAGLGKSYALLLASRGASVVVNDLGGGRDGEGQCNRAADVVVNEIRAGGGKAVANYDSVEDGEKLIQTAIENFGRVDIVVNNAGILRDKSFPRISDQDWDLIQRVHLKGSFKVTQAAWAHFRKQNFGRVIMTSSNSGLYGNFGQANYSAAKLGLVGLANTLAIEGSKYNIHTNVIVPTAASRLTEDILPPDLFAELKPELIAPVVAYLCHESCEDNGAVIEAAAGWAGKCHLVRSKGGLLRHRIGDQVTVEEVARNWGKVVDMSNAERLESIGEASGSLLEKLENLREGSSGSEQDVVEVSTFDSRDFILYALSVGVIVDDAADLKYLDENHENFSVLPTFTVIPALNTWMMNGGDAIKIPGKTINIANVLHGEQYVEQIKPIQGGVKLETRCRLMEIIDKGKGAVAIINTETFDESGDKVATGQVSTFLVGCGGFGGPRNANHVIPTVERPNRSADASVTQQTNRSQAALYRLNGDRNPLHINPDVSALMGFPVPILHGLCSFGISARHVLKQFANNDAALFKAIKVRFAKPVIPGQTLRTDMWREGKRIHFQTTALETGNIVISGAYVDLHEVVPRSEVSVTLNPVSTGLNSDARFAEIDDKIKEDPATAKAVNAVFTYKITKDGKVAKTWTLDLKKPAVYEGDAQGGKADTTFTVSDDDFVDLASGKLNPQMAFMKGKLKIQGNIMMAEKMRGLLNQKSKL